MIDIVERRGTQQKGRERRERERQIDGCFFIFFDMYRDRKRHGRGAGGSDGGGV